MSKWISVKDGMLPKNEIILAVNHEKEMAVCEIKISGDQYFFMLFGTNLQLKNVTHWSWLPLSPEEK